MIKINDVTIFMQHIRLCITTTLINMSFPLWNYGFNKAK